MSRKSNIIVGLDIGTGKTAVVIAELRAGDQGKSPKVEVLGVGATPSRGMRKGVVINIEATVATVTEALSQADHHGPPPVGYRHQAGADRGRAEPPGAADHAQHYDGAQPGGAGSRVYGPGNGPGLRALPLPRDSRSDRQDRR